MISDTFCSFHDFFRSFMKIGFPFPKIAEGESQPDDACINKRYSLISRNLHCASWMPQHLFPFIKNIFLRYSFQWCNNITAIPVPSATTTTWFSFANSKAVEAILLSASPLQTKASCESALKELGSNEISSVLLLGLERKHSFEYRFWLCSLILMFGVELFKAQCITWSYLHLIVNVISSSKTILIEP